MLFECAVMKIKIKVPFSFTYYLLVNSRISLQLLDGSVFLHITKAGSAITNGREPRSCLGRVFNSKLSCFAKLGSKCMMVRIGHF